jgi:hypothetical protein
MRSIKFGNKTMALPASRVTRMGIGIALVLGGFLGFLPILGFWMVPLGLIILSVDVPFVRRWRRRAAVWIGLRLRLRFPWLADKFGFANACPNGLARPYRVRDSPDTPI